MSRVAWQLDTGTDFGRRAERRLLDEYLVWLTTVRADGLPQPSPVWFLWDGETVLIYSEPDKQKLRNIERNAKVSLHFDGDGRGGNVVIITGEARVARELPPAHEVEAFAEKYDSGGFFKRTGTNAAGFASRYSVPIQVRPTGLRGH